MQGKQDIILVQLKGRSFECNKSTHSHPHTHTDTSTPAHTDARTYLKHSSNARTEGPSSAIDLIYGHYDDIRSHTIALREQKREREREREKGISRRLVFPPGSVVVAQPVICVPEGRSVPSRYLLSSIVTITPLFLISGTQLQLSHAWLPTNKHIAIFK